LNLLILPKILFMKIRVSNMAKYFKKLSAKKEITSASVSFQGMQQMDRTVRSKNLTTDFLEEFKQAIRSGDHTLWRMWR